MIVSGETSTQPFVSIIVLNLNGDKVINQCLDCLLNQTYTHYEIIVVDNGSTDKSIAILESYLSTNKMSVVRSQTNRGCAGGRNLGLTCANGELIAFIDNDGYADARWLEEGVRTLISDQTIGAVAAVVFFAKRKLVLNGAGGTLTLRGYGSDICCNEPYEFAQLPHEVLYPMGCGMIVQRAVFDVIGLWDDILPNYYDDVELGIRIWMMGKRVVVAHNAWVDHEHSFSNQFFRNKALLCEKGRIRTVLKYYPIEKLLMWFVKEVRHTQNYPLDKKLLLEAWFWNIQHLLSVMYWRVKFTSSRNRFWNKLHPSWGMSIPHGPNNHEYNPNINDFKDEVQFDGAEDTNSLNYGWYHPEADACTAYRWGSAYSSVLIRFSTSVKSLYVKICVPWEKTRVRIILRSFGEISPLKEHTYNSSNEAWVWEEIIIPCIIPAGSYELLIVPEQVHTDLIGRQLGVAVAAVGKYS